MNIKNNANWETSGTKISALVFGLAWALTIVSGRAAPAQFILFNLANGGDPFREMTEIRRQFKSPSDAPVEMGASRVFMYLAQPREEVVSDLKKFLAASEATRTPVVVQFDGENWWGNRPDLWNWWNPKLSGFSLENRKNVEWAGWSTADAIKIAWRDWGKQIRVLPPPNLMSPPYRVACHEEMQVLVPIILKWWRDLPREEKHLFVGLKLGHESSIGVNAWYYPNGNHLIDQPVSSDPTNKLAGTELPARGMAQIGYAAVKTAGIRCDGNLTEADLAEVVHRHLKDLCQLAAELGVPRNKLFTHAGGWKDNELLYQAALNSFSCPGWSFYRHANDPRGDSGVQEALRHSDAPYWGAVEYTLPGPRNIDRWRQGLATTLTMPHCRYVCIFNYDSARNNKSVIKAVREVSQNAFKFAVSSLSDKTRLYSTTPESASSISNDVAGNSVLPTNAVISLE